MTKLRYSSFAHRVDIDELEAAIGFEPTRQEQDNDVGHCPLPWGLHQNGDTTGKFAIHREKRVFNCWVCGGGSLLSLAMHMNDMDEVQATEWLFQFTGPEAESTEAFVQRIADLMEESKRLPEVLPHYNMKAIEPWIELGHPWFKKRGITPEVAEYFHLGYNEKAIKYAPMVNGKATAEPFRGPAIVLPHFWQGKLVGWQHRWLTDDRPKWCAKYTNTNDLPKKETVWGYDFAKKIIDPPIVVESTATALFLISLGYSSVATFGSGVKPLQVKRLRSFQQGVRIAPDNDSAGRTFEHTLTEGLKRYVPIDVIDPPDDTPGADLGDLSSDPTRARKLIEHV